jgi:LacI family transcriptional regulator
MRDIALIMPDCSNPFFAQLGKFVVDEAYQRHYSVSIVNTADNTANEVDALSRLFHRRVEGIVIFPVGTDSGHLLELPEDVPPIVLVDRWFPNVDLPQVALDNVSAAKLATDYLLDHGHRRIACLRGKTKTAPNEDRLVGYTQALDSRGIPVDDSIIIGEEFSQESGYQGVMQLLKAKKTLSAILSLGNQNTLGALRALKKAGLRVPEDISIVSFDDIEGAEFFTTPLTIVSQPIEQMGRRATKLLFERIEGNVSTKKSSAELMQASLVERESVRKYRGAGRRKKGQINNV